MDKKTNEIQKKTVSLGKKKGGLGAPNIDSLFDPSGLPGLPPIDDIPADDVEAIADREVSDMMRMIKENRKNNAERFRDVEAGEFWCCVCFQSRSQRDEFIVKLLEKFAPRLDIDTFGSKYVSGLDLAEMLGIAITPIILEVKKNRLAPKALRGKEVINNA